MTPKGDSLVEKSIVLTMLVVAAGFLAPTVATAASPFVAGSYSNPVGIVSSAVTGSLNRLDWNALQAETMVIDDAGSLSFCGTVMGNSTGFYSDMTVRIRCVTRPVSKPASTPPRQRVQPPSPSAPSQVTSHPVQSKPAGSPAGGSPGYGSGFGAPGSRS